MNYNFIKRTLKKKNKYNDVKKIRITSPEIQSYKPTVKSVHFDIFR